MQSRHRSNNDIESLKHDAPHSDNFENPIPRGKVKSFAFNALSVKLQTKDKKIKKELQGTRDLFGHLLYMSVNKEKDLKKVLAGPLASVPLTFGHIVGNEISSDKSTLFSKLEVEIFTEKCGCAFCLWNVPGTFSLDLPKLLVV